MLMQHVPNVSSLLARTTDRARAIARAVIDCGVTPELPADLVKPTRLSNNISLVAFSMMLAWLLFEASAGYSAALPWELLWASAFAACPFLNALGQYRTARATLMVVANATVFAGDVIFEPGSGGSLPFIAMVALPLLLSRSGEKALLAIGVVVPVTLFVLCESNALVGALSIEQVPAPSWYFAANALTAFTCAFLLPLFFYQSNRRAELELERREKAKLERLIQSSIIGVARGRIGGPILEANDALLDLLGYSRDELRAGELHLERMTPVEYREVTRRAMATLAKQGVCPAYEKQYVRKDGTRVPVLVGMASMDAEGDTIGFVLDISAQKTAEEQRVLLRQNQETMRMRDLFDSVVSHELKTPLAAVTLQIELGLRALDKNNCDAAKRHLQRCGLSARKLGALVDSLLDSARIHHGKLALSPCEVDLAEMAKSVV
ncbi:MAG TPA: PAS domain S-box protein, partial [Polyangiaceae bacterium]|nr:PAS domain S-box protein [Polyangiaceae bacterium]